MAVRKVNHYHAAGGVVVNREGRVLLLARQVERQLTPSHELRLPKGHIEKGETAVQTAVREVCEESGYCAVEVVADLGTGSTEFALGDGWVHRVEHYFLMRLADGVRTAPQSPHPHSEETLFRPRWASSLEEAEQLLTFESEKRFVRRAQQWVRQGTWIE